MENTKSRRVSSPDPYWNHAFFLHSFRYTKFSGDLHHLLAKRPANILWPFLMMISQPKHLFSPKVIFLKLGTNLRRHQIKLHSYRAKVQWAIIKKRIYLAWGPTWLISRLILISPICWLYQLVCIRGKGYGGLAANIGSTMKPSTNIIFH